jgi:hypothetical protein
MTGDPDIYTGNVMIAVATLLGVKVSIVRVKPDTPRNETLSIAAPSV